MPRESDIRDRLAGDLAALEVGLQLVQVEYPLTNADGTRGFIDILARDQFGSLVVIELKRSDGTASRAIHELFKYTELLAREKGLDSSSVRCMLVSTVWDELRLPFALLTRTFPYDTVGLAIEVDDAGTVLSVETVRPLDAPPPHAVTPVHELFFYESVEDRETAWTQISTALSETDAPDHLALALDRPPPLECRGHGLYLARGRVPATAKLLHLEEDVPDDSIEAPPGCVWEYRALCELAHRYRGAAGAEVGYPDKLRYMLGDGGWQVSRVFRAGRFASQADIVDDEQLIEAAGGTSGASDVALGVRSSPQRHGHWQSTRDKIRRALVGNPLWEEIVEALLAEMETSTPTAEIVVAIFNPCDVIGSIVNTLTGGDSMPRLACQVVIDGEVTREVVGTLVSEPGNDLVGICRAFEETYDDVFQWGLARNLAATWTYDIELCRRVGLVYACAEFLPEAEGVWLEVTDGDLIRTSFAERTPERQPLDEWLRANRADLDRLVEVMSQETRGIFPGLADA